MKKVLVLGSGLVARPLVRHLLDRGFQVVVATLTVDRAGEMIAGHPHGSALFFDVRDETRLSSMIEESDLAVSLLPFSFHPLVARHCINRRKHMVTTSYVSPDMKGLDEEARAAGVTILNEIGLDPGLDHMSAMRVIDRMHRSGGRIVSFRSYCGGLPAPEANDNPFGYKFSWAPRGVLMAGRNGARYLLDGRIMDVPPHRLFRDMHILAIESLGDFEAYPNRDSISYIDIYGLAGIQTIYRGTLRNMGWCDCLYNIGKLNLLSLNEMDVEGKTYADFMRDLIGASPSKDLKTAMAAWLAIPREAFPVSCLEWLGMFSDRPIAGKRIAPLDALGDLMFEKLAFRKNERDMIVLHHEFRIEDSEGRRQRTVAQLIDFGVPGGDSSMSRTVSLPAAVAAELILAGRIRETGVLRPIAPDIYGPVLDELSVLKIECNETTEAW